MAIGGGKFSGNGGKGGGRISPGEINNNTTGDVPEDKKSRRFINVESGTVTQQPPQSTHAGIDVELTPEQQAEATAALGPVERREDDDGGGGKKRHRKDRKGVDAAGPLPLWMERQRRQNPHTATAAETGGVCVRSIQPTSSSSQGAAPGTSDVNIINHTAIDLRLVAVDAAGTGGKVERVLRAKNGDSFVAPLGCIITIMHPVTGKAVFRYKVSGPSTTLAVTDAAISTDGVGGSGKWYDNRVFLALAGATGVCILLAIAAGAAFLIHHLAKKYAAAGGGGGGGFKR